MLSCLSSLSPLLFVPALTEGSWLGMHKNALVGHCGHYLSFPVVAGCLVPWIYCKSQTLQLSCVGSVCTKIEGKGLGSICCDKWHFSSPAFGSLSEPVLSQQLCLWNHTVQLQFDFPVSTCQGDIWPCLRSIAAFHERWSPQTPFTLFFLFSRLGCSFILHLNMNFFIIILLLRLHKAKDQENREPHGKTHLLEGFAAPLLALSVSSHGKYHRRLAVLRNFHISCWRDEEETWICYLHVLQVPHAKSVLCLCAAGNTDQLFRPQGNVCKSENEQKDRKPYLFSFVPLSEW